MGRYLQPGAWILVLGSDTSLSSKRDLLIKSGNSDRALGLCLSLAACSSARISSVPEKVPRIYFKRSNDNKARFSTKYPRSLVNCIELPLPTGVYRHMKRQQVCKKFISCFILSRRKLYQRGVLSGIIELLYEI